MPRQAELRGETREEGMAVGGGDFKIILSESCFTDLLLLFPKNHKACLPSSLQVDCIQDSFIYSVE